MPGLIRIQFGGLDILPASDHDAVFNRGAAAGKDGGAGQ